MTVLNEVRLRLSSAIHQPAHMWLLLAEGYIGMALVGGVAAVGAILAGALIRRSARN